MQRVLDWLKMRTTQIGLAAVLIAILEQFAPEVAQYAIEVLAFLGLALPDRNKPAPPTATRRKATKKRAPKAALSAFLVLALFASGCGASLADIPIDDETKMEIAIEAGCAAAATEGCFDDQDVQDLFGKLKTSEQCVAAVKDFVATENISIDLLKLTARTMTCKRFVDAFWHD